MTREDLLAYLPENIRGKAENIVEDIVGFYGDSIQVNFEDRYLSHYYREGNFTTEPFKAAGRIVISNEGDTGPATLHELLHLRVALKHKAYALYFTPGTVNQDTVDYVMSIINVIEHDLFIEDFLSVGYEKKHFLRNSFHYVDYKREKLLDETWHYWAFEYFRLTFNLQHIPESDVPACRNAIQKVREYALRRYPDLQETLQAIRQWITDKAYHKDGSFIPAFCKLCDIFRIPKPTKFLAPGDFQTLEVVNI